MCIFCNFFDIEKNDNVWYRKKINSVCYIIFIFLNGDLLLMMILGLKLFIFIDFGVCLVSLFSVFLLVSKQDDMQEKEIFYFEDRKNGKL